MAGTQAMSEADLRHAREKGATPAEIDEMRKRRVYEDEVVVGADVKPSPLAPGWEHEEEV